MRVRRSYLFMPNLGAQIFALLPDDGTGGDGAQTGAPQSRPQGDPGPASSDLPRDLHDERKRRQAAEKRLAEFEAAQKKADEEKLSEQERVAKRAADAERERDAARAELARINAARAAKLDVEWADRLRGATPEELEADAYALKERLGESANATNGDAQGGTGSPPQGTARRLPRPDPSQGSKQTAPPSGRDAGLAEARRRFAPREPAKG